MLSQSAFTRLRPMIRKGHQLANVYVTLVETCKPRYIPPNIRYSISRQYLLCQKEICKFENSNKSVTQQIPSVHVLCNQLGNGHVDITRQQQQQQQRYFHTTGSRQAIPPIIWAVVNIVGRVSAVLVPRYLRKRWLKRQPKELQQKYHNWMMRSVFGALALFGVVGGIYYYCHIQEAPITKRKRFISLTKDQYLKVADFETEGYLEEYKDTLLPATSDYYARVLRVSRRVVSANQDVPGMSSQQWVIHVINDETRNAFVLPASDEEEKEEKLVTRSGGEWICLKPRPLLDDFVAEANRIRDRESQQEGRRVVEKEQRARDRLAKSQFFDRRGVSWPGRKKIEQESHQVCTAVKLYPADLSEFYEANGMWQVKMLDLYPDLSEFSCCC